MGASPRIGIFGGSFNPPHNGHVEICRYVLAHDAVDHVLVIPCLAHAFHKPLVPFKDRVAMCRAAFAGMPHVEVSKIEKELGEPSHTMRTVEALRRLQPTAQLLLVVGEDLLEEMALWKDIEALRAAVEWLTIPRGPAGPIPDVSATAIRDRVAAGESIAALVPSAVAEYIRTHRLYGDVSL